MPPSLDESSQRSLASFAGGSCSSAKGSSACAYIRQSSALKSGRVRVMRSVISLLPASACAYGSDPDRRVKGFESASFQSVEFGLYAAKLCMLRKVVSDGVLGLSVSGRLASSSSTRSSKDDVSSSLKNVRVLRVMLAVGCVLDVEGRRGEGTLWLSVDGKPNSIASSNFCGEAK